MSLGTRKSAQTGILHAWRLHANDEDTKMCPMRATLMLALLYGEGFELSGSLYHRVDKVGAILRTPMVCH